MTIPTALPLFHPAYAEPVNTATQVDRFPPHDAPCMCGRDDCEERGYPFCKPPEKEDE